MSKLPTTIPNTSTQGVVATALSTSLDSFSGILASPECRNRIAQCAAKTFDPDRLRRVAYLAATKQPKLTQCTSDSIINALAECAATGLEPFQGRAYLIPYSETVKGPDGKAKKDTNGNYIKEDRCQFQIGYQGLVELAYRSGQVTKLIVQVVKREDEFSLNLGDTPPFTHVVKLRTADDELARAKEVREKWEVYSKNKWNNTTNRPNPTPTIEGDEGILYYCYAEFKNGLPRFDFMTRSQIEELRWQHSKSASDGPWVTSYDEMAKKTVIRRAVKLWPLIEMKELAAAIELDDEQNTEIIDISPELQAAIPTHVLTPAIDTKALESNLLDSAIDTAMSGPVEPESVYHQFTRQLGAAKTVKALNEIGNRIKVEESTGALIADEIHELRDLYKKREAELRGA